MKRKENIIIILAIIISIFIIGIIPLKNTVTVNLQNADNYLEELTTFSLTAVNNWLKEGIINDNFVMYGDYASVEFENNNNRSLTVSYPPGYLIPLYIIAKAAGKKELSIGFIIHFIQFEYYLSILLLGLLFYVCLKFIRVESKFLKIFLPVMLSTLWAFLPYNVYYMNNIYFTDQAVILLSIIFFLIEIALYGNPLRKWEIILQILSGMVLFAGILTDYYFVTIAFVALCFRVMNNFQEYPGKSFLFKLLSRTWPLIISPIIAAALFLIQLSIVPDGLKLLALTFLIRSGSGSDFGGLNALINHFNIGFSAFAIPILFFATFFCLIFPFIKNNYSKDKQMIINWLSIIVLSTVLHTIILREHSVVHEFSLLKYNLVFVFIIFTFICWIYLNYKTSAVVRSKKYSKIILAFIFCLVILCIVGLKSYDKIFYISRMNTQDHTIAEFIGEHTNYYDVVYSPDYEINWNPSQDLAISKKRIYKVSSLREIPYDNLPDHAMINILISGDSLEKANWNKLLKAKILSNKSDHLYLFKFSKKSISSIMH